MYCDYWNLTKPPFDNVPDASMYVDCHESMENIIAETIFAIKEGNECLTVIVGEVGLGKTLSIRVIIDSLEPEKYKVALITNPALSFVQLLREIIGQITGKQCEVKNKVDLLEMFNHLLFEAADQGKKIVIVIDEANVISSSILDNLRLLTNMQDDERNLFTLVLVGQIELAKTLEHPKRNNIFQRIGTYGRLEKLPSPEAVKTYIESRLKIAGTERKIFDDDAIPVIWKFSEHGIPRLVNKICKLCIKAGETNEFASISGDVAQQIADRFQKLSKTPVQKRKVKSITEAQPSEESVNKIKSEKIPKTPRPSIPVKEESEVTPPAVPAPFPTDEPKTHPIEETMPVMTIPEQLPEMPAEPPAEEPVSFSVEETTPAMTMPEKTPEMAAEPSMEEPVSSPVEETTPVITMPEQVPEMAAEPPVEEIESPPVEETKPVMTMPEQLSASPMEESQVSRPQTVPLAKTSANFVPTLRVLAAKSASAKVSPQQETRSAETLQKETEGQPQTSEEEVFEDVLIGQQKIKLAIPAHIIKQAQLSNNENKNKLAGYWSAQILKSNPNLTHSSVSDPVSMWFEVKNVILNKFNSP